MSWSTFKSNILNQTEGGMDNINDVASIWAREYNSAILRGFDVVHKIPIQIGNTALLEQLILIALQRGGVSNSSSFSLVSEMGKGVIAYWTGATMKLAPIPIIPAPGSIQNVSTTSNVVLSPGTWPPAPPVPPNNNAGLMIDVFIQTATAHLLSVSGLINTISLYPAAPSPVPGPGIISWTGYQVP